METAGSVRIPPDSAFGPATVRAASGQEYLLPPPRLSARYRLREGTFAGMGSKEEDAPIPAVRGTAIELLKPTRSYPS